MPTSSLTPAQEHVAASLASGSTLAAAAEAAGVHRNTITYWRRHSTDFREAVNHAYYEKALIYREKAEDLAILACDALRKTLEDPASPPGIRLKAALAVLDKVSAPPPPAPQTLWVYRPLEFPSATPSVTPTPEPETVHKPEIVHKNAQNCKTEAPNPEPSPVEPVKTYVRPGPKVSRNALCPCGSKLKYKRCCLNKPVESTAAA